MVYVSGIDFESITDGDGVRIVVFVSGCLHKCEGCHNPLAHNFKYGKPFDENMQEGVIKHCETTPYISGITLSGGDPMYSADELIPFLQKFRKKCPDKDVWCYTGFLYEELEQNESMANLASLCDVIVDGPFVQEKRSFNTPYMGSTNQRIIRLTSNGELERERI